MPPRGRRLVKAASHRSTATPLPPSRNSASCGSVRWGRIRPLGAIVLSGSDRRPSPAERPRFCRERQHCNLPTLRVPDEVLGPDARFDRPLGSTQTMRTPNPRNPNESREMTTRHSTVSRAVLAPALLRAVLRLGSDPCGVPLHRLRGQRGRGLPQRARPHGSHDSGDDQAEFAEHFRHPVRRRRPPLMGEAARSAARWPPRCPK